MRSVIFTLAFLGLLTPGFGLAIGTTEDPVVPCRDPRGCPDLVVEEWRLALARVTEQSFDVDDCAVVEGLVEPGHRRLLRLTFETPNVGAGDLIIGRVEDNPDLFEESACHGHHHMKSYADYRLWTPAAYAAWDLHRSTYPDETASQALDARPDLQTGLISAHKQGFCVMDLHQPVLTRHGVFHIDPEPGKYDCSNMGLSRRWSDAYAADLDGQWVDVTDARPGTYVLEAEVNPEHLVQESSYANNRGAIPVILREG